MFYNTSLWQEKIFKKMPSSSSSIFLSLLQKIYSRQSHLTTDESTYKARIVQLNVKWGKPTLCYGFKMCLANS